MARDLKGRVAEHATEELRRMKEEHDAVLERNEKNVVELKRNEVLAKTSTIEEFKASDDYKEAVEKLASSYFGEGFNLCKKQIGLLHPNLDIQDLQINPKLAEEDEEEKEEEKNEEGNLDNNPLSP